MTISTSRRHVVTLLLAAMVTLAHERSADAGPLRMDRRGSDSHWVDGAVDIAAAPASVRSALANVAAWPQLFTDVASVAVTSRSDAKQVAAVHSRILGGHAHDFTVVEAGSRFDVAIDVTGADAHGTFVIMPGERENTSRVAFSLYAAKSGVAGLFVSDATLRAKQEAIVRTYLTDLARLERR